jgi:uncharacterized protein YbcV (DUF1398 family)
MGLSKDFYAEFAFEELGRMVGGHKEYFVSDQTIAMVWNECHTNEHLITLAGMYLVGSSERAERNLTKLQDALRLVFITRNVMA